jgi:hypothetical protein
MTASVSAPNGNANTWNVEIQGAPDTNNNLKDYTVVQSLGMALHTETVNCTATGHPVRYWNLNAGTYVVTWSGRSVNCALACFNLGQLSSGFMATATPVFTKTLTMTPTLNGGGNARTGEGGLETTPTLTPTLTPWTHSRVVAAPNLSMDGAPIQFRVNLENPSAIQLSIYNILGERVYSTEVPGNAGLNQVEWDLQNLSGSPVAAGLYIYQARAGNGTYGGKVVVIH